MLTVNLGLLKKQRLELLKCSMPECYKEGLFELLASIADEIENYGSCEIKEGGYANA